MHAKLRTRLLLACLALGVVLTGCSAPTGQQNLSAEKTENATSTEELDAVVTTFLDESGIPGAAVLSTHDDGTKNLVVYGESSLDTATTEDSTFAYRSITKSFIGTVILQLSDEGLVDLDSPASGYLSEHSIDPAITVAELAAMRSGLANYSAMPGFGELLTSGLDRAVSVNELLELPLSAPLEFSPGSAYEYSNTNTLLLGEIIEQVTGKSWLAEVEDRILRPLGLSSVEYGFHHPAIDAVGFQVTGTDAAEELPTVAPEWFGAAGGLTGNIHDLVAWGEELGTGTLLSPGARQLRTDMFGSTKDDPNSPHYDRYGFAIGELDGWIGHTGNGLGFQSLVMHNPENGTTIAILLNGTGENPDLPADLFQQVLEARF